MTMSDIEDEVQKFQRWLEEETACSGGTPNMYAAYIKRLEEPIDLEKHSVGEALEILENAVTNAPVRAAFKKYLTYLRQTNDVSLQQRRDLSFLRDELNELQVSQGKELDKSEVLRKYLRWTEIQDLMDYIATELDAADFGNNKRWYDEFYILPLFMFETGCRIGEVIGKQNDPENTGLRVTDLNFEKNTVRIRNSKGGKDRIAHFNDVTPLLVNHLENYGIERGKVFSIPYWRQNYQFKSTGKELFGFPGPNDRTAENEYRLTAHWMRHSFATNWVIKQYQKTGGWAEAKERVHNYLDHDQMSTTEAYIGAAKELEQENIYDDEGGFNITVQASRKC